MTLVAGGRVGPYEVTGKLGEGGMGEVWRATDSRLRREVAIKVLPAAFTGDPERLARFEREAQLLAQLHHPNVASIFGLEESDGTRALVMELVEGSTLAERLAVGPLLVDEALGVALQIALALEAAHERGIVHRDLKPQNVKIQPGGELKVLDFGLAKAMEPGAIGSPADLARSPTLLNSPTLTAAHGTQLGTILGTAAYMAPEQARGGAADRRADVWALGVVLFEMLTGRSLFAGETGGALVLTIFGGSGMSDAKAALLDLASREVTPLLPGGAVQYVPSGHLVLFRAGAWFAVPFDARSRRVTGPERRVLRDARPLNPIGGRERTFAVADGGLLAYVASPHSDHSPHTCLAWIDRDGRVDPLPFEGQHEYGSLDLSPDDGRVAVALASAGELQVWVYDLALGTRERVTRDGLNLDPIWHPDGSRLAVTSLHRGNFDLREVRSDGGAQPVPLVATDEDDNELAWAPGGEGFVFTHSSAETGQDVWVREPGPAGRERPLVATPFDDNRSRLSPDGRWVLYEDQTALYVTDYPAARQRVQLAAGGRFGKWSPATPEVFALQSGKVVAVRYEATGERFRVLEARTLFPAPALPIEVDFDVSRDASRFLFLVPVPGKTLGAEVRVVTDGFALLREGDE